LTLIRGGLVQSAHDCSDGGLAVTLAESCISGPDRPLGAVVKLTQRRLRRDAILFGESQSRVVVSARPVHRQRICDLAARSGVPVEVIGSVEGDRLVVNLKGEPAMHNVIDIPVATLYDRWTFSLERALTRT
jgi:phosphoribosylformylglycinamidine synthase